MNIVAIIGSPHGMQGNTGTLLQSLVESAESAGARVNVFSLAAMKVKPCVACDVCHKTGECAVRDDFGKIKDAMLCADGVVLASPNYIMSVSAQMKAMMDRCCGLLHCQALDGKYAAAVVSSGGNGGEIVEDYLLRFLRFMGSWTVGSVNAQVGQLIDGATRAGCLESAARLGKNLVEAIAKKKTFKGQVKEKQAFAGRMKALVSARQEDWPFEYKLWKSLGRL